ncbi:MAG TPA: acetyltransferase, partial [Gammaproteobacteria bacterium]|nr:acetyltransferase [Gammaproteobacteria bacterium]
MLKQLPSPIKGILNAFALVIHTFFWGTLLFCFFLVKIAMPLKAWHHYWSAQCIKVGEWWTATCMFMQKLTTNFTPRVEGLEALNKHSWYFIAANHQSWTDIFLLLGLFNKKIPFIKFFIKDQLKYFPILGFAWWAFEYPRMKRYSEKTLQSKPQLRGKDLETTLKQCNKFLQKPTTLLSFIEGTRFTPAKHKKQNSPFKHLLRPKAGGFALTIHALRDRIDHVLHVTIAYPKDKKNFWHFLCGHINTPYIKIEKIKIPDYLFSGDYFNDPL